MCTPCYTSLHLFLPQQRSQKQYYRTLSALWPTSQISVEVLTRLLQWWRVKMEITKLVFSHYRSTNSKLSKWPISSIFAACSLTDSCAAIEMQPVLKLCPRLLFVAMLAIGWYQRSTKPVLNHLPLVAREKTASAVLQPRYQTVDRPYVTKVAGRAPFFHRCRLISVLMPLLRRGAPSTQKLMLAIHGVHGHIVQYT